jgi:hypothetical protein
VIYAGFDFGSNTSISGWWSGSLTQAGSNFWINDQGHWFRQGSVFGRSILISGLTIKFYFWQSTPISGLMTRANDVCGVWFWQKHSNFWMMIGFIDSGRVQFLAETFWCLDSQSRSLTCAGFSCWQKQSDFWIDKDQWLT